MGNYKNIQIECKQTKVWIEFLGERTYTFDIQVEDQRGRKICCEVDGRQGHSGRWNIAQDRARDRAMCKIGIRTVRIQTIDLIGKKKLSDEDILNDINWQLQRQ